MSESYLALDPGGSTGLAWYRGDEFHTQCMEVMKSDMRAIVWDIIARDWDHVVIEKFATAGRLSSAGLFTIELVGACMGICHITHTPLTVEAPVIRHPWQATADAMAKGHIIHERDALAHLLSWLYHHNRDVLTQHSITIQGNGPNIKGDIVVVGGKRGNLPGVSTRPTR